MRTTKQTSSLDDIRARAEAATEGPWLRYGDLGFEVYSAAEFIDGEPGPYITEGHLREADADFIAHARTDIPKLLSALDAIVNLSRVRQSLRCGIDTDEVFERIDEALK